MPEERSPIRIEISYKTIIFTIALLAGLWFVIRIREIIILIFLSVILLSALLRPVEWLTSKKIPRVLSVILVYVLLIIFIAFIVGTIIPPLVSQTSEFISKLPQIVSTVNDFFIFHKIPTENFTDVISKQLQQIGGNIISISTTIFSSIILFFTLFVLTFYLLLEWKYFLRIITSSFSGKQEKKIVNVISKVEKGLGIWVRGQLALSIIVGVLTFIGLRILGIPYALPLSLIAAIFEIIPIVGPIISAIPAILVGLTITPIMGLAVVALFIIVQQLENHLIVPMVMSKMVGLQPPIVIIALLIGAKLAGVGGAFLAVPTIVLIKIIFQELMVEDQKFEDDLKEE